MKTRNGASPPRLNDGCSDIVRFFGLMNKNRPFTATYDEHLTAGLECKFRGKMTWPEMLGSDDTCLLLNDITFNELARIRFWGREVIIKGWLEYIVNLSANKTKNISAFDVLELFNAIYARDFERDAELVARYRRASISRVAVPSNSLLTQFLKHLRQDVRRVSSSIRQTSIDLSLA
ncbi:MAG TPA: hypothetical protein VKM55_15115 [Candidatus Lokiarchaeia archaeon]|nr:hypothetical protein [Candidatus Lokiarchaeia archaeon]